MLKIKTNFFVLFYYKDKARKSTQFCFVFINDDTNFEFEIALFLSPL